MDSSGSILLTLIGRVRSNLDDPSLDAKYPDDWLLRHVIAPSIANVHSRLNLSAQNAVINTFSLAVTTTTSQVVLPSCVQEVTRVVQRDVSDGTVLQDWKPKGPRAVTGPGWRIEANTLRFDPLPSFDATWTLEYVSTGDSAPYYDTDCDWGADLKTIILKASPLYGWLDKRPGAYVGQMIRLLGTSVYEERIVTGYDPSTRTVTVETAFTYGNLGDSAISVEICVRDYQAMMDVVALDSSLRMGMVRNIDPKKMQMLTLQYRSAFKTIADHFSNMNMRNPKSFDKSSLDSGFLDPLR